MSPTQVVFVAMRDYHSEGLGEPIFVFANEVLARAFMLGRDVERYKLFPCKVKSLQDMPQGLGPTVWEDGDDPQLAELSVRTSNCLRQAGIEKVVTIRETPDEKFLKTPNFGRKSVNELRDVFGPYRKEKTAT